jgi:glycosyltransferase involved in cell wall biosynthesis
MLYVGTLDERVDLSMVRALAAARPEGSVVLIGPGAGSGPVASLAGIANVHVRRPVAREELVALVAAADLGLIPHVRSEQTRAMSPLKLHEYLAAGLPVAATDLPGVAGVCPDRVLLATTRDDFAAAASAALGLDRWDEDARRAFIVESSWSSRFEVLLDLALARTDRFSSSRNRLAVGRSDDA